MDHDEHAGEDTVFVSSDDEGETYQCLICGERWHEGYSN